MKQGCASKPSPYRKSPSKDGRPLRSPTGRGAAPFLFRGRACPRAKTRGWPEGPDEGGPRDSIRNRPAVGRDAASGAAAADVDSTGDGARPHRARSLTSLTASAITPACGRRPRRCRRRGRGRRRRSNSDDSAASGPARRCPCRRPRSRPYKRRRPRPAFRRRRRYARRPSAWRRFRSRRTACRDSEASMGVGPGLLRRDFHDERKPQRFQRGLVEPLRARKVGDRDSDMVEHGVAPSFPPDRMGLRPSDSPGAMSPRHLRDSRRCFPATGRRSTKARPSCSCWLQGEAGTAERT